MIKNVTVQVKLGFYFADPVEKFILPKGQQDPHKRRFSRGVLKLTSQFRKLWRYRTVEVVLGIPLQIFLHWLRTR